MADRVRRVTACLLILIIVLAGCAGPERPRKPKAAAKPTPARIAPQLPTLPTLRPVRIADAVAIHVPSAGLPASADIPRWLGELARAGFTAIVLDAGTPPPSALAKPAPRGVYFRTALADLVRDAVGEVIGPAHQQDFTVFVAVPVRAMGWIDGSLGWQDRSFDPEQQRFYPSGALDLFHPALQEYVGGLLTDLGATGIDGVLFEGEPAMRSVDGFSSYAVSAFERDFHVTLTPETWAPWPVAADREPKRRVAAGRAAEPAPPALAPDFWRWIGWKARERSNVLGRFARAVRAKYPSMVFAMDMHPEAGHDPVAALIRYSEDVLEAKRNGIDIFVIGTSETTGVATTAAKRLGELLGDARRTWVITPLATGDPLRVGPRLDLATDRAGLDRGTGLLYEVGAPLP